MKKTIYIHIGIGKTGTSAIQKGLIMNRDVLLEQDIFIPRVGLDKNNIGHHSLANFQELEPSESTKKLYNQLLKEINDIKQNNIIISSENFCYCKPKYIEFIKEIFRNYNIQIILFVREHLKLAESTYLLWQSQGYNYKYNIQDFMKMIGGGFNYDWMSSQWTNIFCNNCMIIKIYDKKYFAKGILNYFFQDIFKDISIREVKDDVNKSLHPVYSPFISYLDQKIPSLLDKNSIDMVLRKRIIDTLILHPEKILSRELVLNGILLSLRELFDTIELDFEIKNDVEEFVSLYITNLDLNYTFMTQDINDYILNYYKETNYSFSNKFLTEEEKQIFMKNYKV